MKISSNFFFDMAKAYKSQLVKDKMIEEGEEDIENGRLFSLEEAKEIVLKWKKE
jgi:predicted transcriptional regulator